MNGDTNIADLVRKLRDDVLSLLSEEVALKESIRDSLLPRLYDHILTLESLRAA